MPNCTFCNGPIDARGECPCTQFDRDEAGNILSTPISDEELAELRKLPRQMILITYMHRDPQTGAMHATAVVNIDSCECMPDKHQHYDCLLSLECPEWEKPETWRRMCSCSRHQSYLDAGEMEKLSDLLEIYRANQD